MEIDELITAEWEVLDTPSLFQRVNRRIDRKWSLYDRKLRLWEIACLRHSIPLEFATKQILDSAEKLLDGDGFTRKNQRRRHNWYTNWNIVRLDSSGSLAIVMSSIIQRLPSRNKPHHALVAAGYCGYSEILKANLFRDIIQLWNVQIEPEWLTSTVTAIAEGIYEEDAHDRMPILADALQDTGCENTLILNHCRAAKPHAKGCWVIDLLTGRHSPTVRSRTWNGSK